jgi:hypothetical protein
MPAVYPDFYKIILTRVLHASGAGCDTELRHHPESAPGKMDDELTTEASGEELLTHSGNCEIRMKLGSDHAERLTIKNLC